MLTTKQIKQIKSYYKRLKLAFPAFLVSILIGVPFILCVMIGDIFLGADLMNEAGFAVYLGTVILYMIYFIYAVLSVRFGMMGRKWKEILALSGKIYQRNIPTDGAARAAGTMAAGRLMQMTDNDTLDKAGKAVELAGAVDAAAAAAEIIGTMGENIETAAERFGVELPSYKGARRAVIWMPVLLLILSFIPGYMRAVSDGNELLEQRRTIMERYETAFQGWSSSFLGNDIEDKTRDNFSCSYRETYGSDPYILFSMDKAGTLKDIAVCTRIAPELSLEENLQNYADFSKKALERLEKAGNPMGEFSEIDLESLNEEAMTEYQKRVSGRTSVPETFEEEIRYSAEYGEIYFSFSENIADEEEPYFYFSLR